MAEVYKFLQNYVSVLDELVVWVLSFSLLAFCWAISGVGLMHHNRATQMGFVGLTFVDIGPLQAHGNLRGDFLWIHQYLNKVSMWDLSFFLFFHSIFQYHVAHFGYQFLIHLITVLSKEIYVSMYAWRII